MLTYLNKNQNKTKGDILPEIKEFVLSFVILTHQTHSEWVVVILVQPPCWLQLWGDAWVASHLILFQTCPRINLDWTSAIRRIPTSDFIATAVEGQIFLELKNTRGEAPSLFHIKMSENKNEHVHCECETCSCAFMSSAVLPPALWTILEFIQCRSVGVAVIQMAQVRTYTVCSSTLCHDEMVAPFSHVRWRNEIFLDWSWQYSGPSAFGFEQVWYKENLWEESDSVSISKNLHEQLNYRITELQNYQSSAASNYTYIEICLQRLIASTV